jgi:YD repeat-containing protein
MKKTGSVLLRVVLILAIGLLFAACHKKGGHHNNTNEEGSPEGGGGSTALAAPTSLTATAVSTREIDLTWIDNSDNEKGFIVERRIGTAEFSVLNDEVTNTSTAEARVVTYKDTPVSLGTEYCYRVKAYKAFGESNYSNEACATPAPPKALYLTTATHYDWSADSYDDTVITYDDVNAEITVTYPDGSFDAYSYDTDGTILSIESYDNSPVPVLTWSIDYIYSLTDGTLSRINYFNDWYDLYSYNVDGSINSIKHYDNADNYQGKVFYYYNLDGSIDYIEFYNSTDTKTGENDYYYNTDGTLSYIKYYTLPGPTYQGEDEFTYDAAENLIYYAYWDDTLGSYSWWRSYEYDADGKLITTTYPGGDARLFYYTELDVMSWVPVDYFEGIYNYSL